MTHRSSDEKFLRAAIRMGLRLQRNKSTPASARSDGVATLQRIKASLRKRNSNLKASL
jgi:hypothetical protein